MHPIFHFFLLLDLQQGAGGGKLQYPHTKIIFITYQPNNTNKYPLFYFKKYKTVFCLC
jgi:hypothetical protein